VTAGMPNYWVCHRVTTSRVTTSRVTTSAMPSPAAFHGVVFSDDGVACWSSCAAGTRRWRAATAGTKQDAGDQGGQDSDQYPD